MAIHVVPALPPAELVSLGAPPSADEAAGWAGVDLIDVDTEVGPTVVACIERSTVGREDGGLGRHRSEYVSGWCHY